MRFVWTILAAAALVAVAGGHASVQPALALHHISEITEVMSGFDGDPNVQFVEIEQLAIYQDAVTNTRLTAFNADGSLAGVLLDPIGGNVSIFGDKWIMGTAAFEAASGISADFTFPPGILPAAGMVCWGAPDVFAPLPGTWDASDPNNYVDCVSYGGAGFTGTNPMSPDPASSGAGDDTLSLTRSTSSTAKSTSPWRNSDDSTDFKLAVPSPTNDAGEVGSLIAGQPPPSPSPSPSPSPAPGPLPVGGVSLDEGLRGLPSASTNWIAAWLVASVLGALLVTASMVAGAVVVARRSSGG